MQSRAVRFVVAVPIVAMATACGSSPTQPSNTASVTAPRPLQPANGATINNSAQPLTLVVQNAVVTKAAGATYTFEVATDAGFSAKVQTKDGVVEGSAGQTSVKLDQLGPQTDYYWHARAQGGGTTGMFGPTFKLTVGPAVVINAPVPIGPLNGAQTAGRPALRVTNATRTGPAGPITYKFEIAATSTFSPVLVTGTASEGLTETGFIPPNDLPVETAFFWRATAVDATNGVTSPASAVEKFVTKASAAGAIAEKLGVVLWPGAQPPGNNGQAVLGNFWGVETLTSFDGVKFLNPPLEEVRIFDLLDRGFDPQAAIDWMKGNGYPTVAAFYPGVNVIGFQFEYLALVNGQWNVVLKVGA